uniref:6-phosphogluconate dehydrogenase, decarboxylating n=1 Tax=Aplanochytrium stocchinoi TaxID=215587 RepID=A0A7S3LH01_9STRA|mmetsp:Transcript_1635/g.2469  ORF Transcript_1635/g.2469 Transcript_1635/m.2469 type:complete len:496 (+) Transcript_1635:111-1598(+)|eukprot:CAMPEP_0204841254 /NCGR_PEP_ID=MMETSP1346-20131115/41344_1 /ASSEMBLY_ACC=CAM_ASM_000771 /TAXON_ID=215587 /ORGANISM="Aplanochytrium stocchinoi, Strain GSBS06" /LENGTH=495 /DNA_ID=CAMNT_0051979277 /DNA_START=21 /DNA_END=1508 /DNA_ORIENTATION=-
MAEFGLYGLAVMGQNWALNVAEHGFTISVCNRSPEKVDVCVSRAKAELGDKASNLTGYKDVKEFVDSLSKPRKIMFLVKAGKPVDASIALFMDLLEEGDILIDGGNEWFENTIRRTEEVAPKGIIYMAMGVSGGEEGARNGPSLMPGGDKAGYDAIEPIIMKCAAQTDSGPCTTYIGGVGSGNYVKMVHNGIEYGDMQLIAEAYTILKTVANIGNDELAAIFEEWNKAELDSFLMEITAKILAKKDVDVYTSAVSGAQLIASDEGTYLVDQILDATGNKGTGKMTIKEGAERAVAVGTMAGALDARFIAFDKDARKVIAPLVDGPTKMPAVDKRQLIDDVRNALYCSKICSYAQGMNLIREASNQYDWGVNLGECARIWKGGCIIRAKFLDRIKTAYDKDANLVNLLIDPDFKEEMAVRQSSWRRITSLCAAAGIPIPSMYSSLAYFDQYRRETLIGASLVQGQRDFFGSHTFERKDKPRGEKFHCKWTDAHNIE